MKHNDRHELFSALGRVSSIGLQLAVSVLICLVVGRWLDQSYGTSPWGAVIGVVMGMVAGMYSAYRIAIKGQKQDE